MTAEDHFSEEEEEEEEDPHTSEYHSPPEEISDSEEERQRERVRSKPSSSRERVQTERGRGRERASPRGSKPPETADTETTSAPAEEKQRVGSERHHSFGGGALSPVQESPEYAHTPSPGGSADDLETLTKALSHLDSETSGLQADAKEVEFIEREAARISEARRQSGSPLSNGTPTTPNTVVWERGTCIELTSTSTPAKNTAKEDGQAEERQGETKGEVGQGDTKGKVGERGEGGIRQEKVSEPVSVAEKGSGEGEGEGGEFGAIPKVAPSLGLKEGHDRQQLAVARSSVHRRPPTRHSTAQVHVHVSLYTCIIHEAFYLMYSIYMYMYIIHCILCLCSRYPCHCHIHVHVQRSTVHI